MSSEGRGGGLGERERVRLIKAVSGGNIQAINWKLVEFLCVFLLGPRSNMNPEN